MDTPRTTRPKAGRTHVALGPALALSAALCLAACGPPDPLEDGLSRSDQKRLVALSIEEIEFIENFDPSDFEASQREHFETMTEGMRRAALDHLPTRIANIERLEMSQSLELDEESAEIEWKQLASGVVHAEVSVEGTRSYSTTEADRDVETRYSLPWVISSAKGELVLRHEGIRTKNL